MASPNQDLKLSESIGIIGAGPAGLINAHVLLQDGFKNIQVITRDPTVGGVWARQRMYPGLRINNVHGEYRFSAMEMPPPVEFTTTGGHLSGLEVCNYLEGYYERFLKDKVGFKFNTEVLNVSRGEDDGVWIVKTKNSQTQAAETLSFSKIILATGGCSEPKIPDYLSPATAEKCQYRGIVAHSSEFAARGDEIMKSIKGQQSGDGESPPVVVVVGGGKSAQDACVRLTQEGFKCVNVFDRGDSFLAAAAPLPTFIRRGRFISLLSPHIHLRTWLERMLHGTAIGAKIVRFLWRKLEEDSYGAFEIPRESPLRRTFPLFWSVRTSDEGVATPNSYYAQAHSNKIEVIAPARAAGFSSDGRSILLDNGRSIVASALILATGYQPTWPKIFSGDFIKWLRNKHAPTTKVADTWNYYSLSGAPTAHPDSDKWVTSLHRGIVPAKNILRRDFAVAGAMFTANAGYTMEVVAHWISSYFLNDDMRLPSGVEEAMAESERAAAWMKRRYPSVEYWTNVGYMGRLDFWTWPQAADDLLEDMGLPIHRSGGNWLTWPFKVVDMKELASLSDERRVKRLETTSRHL